MKTNSRICLINLAFFVLLLAAPNSICAQDQTTQTLALSQPIEQEIKGVETQTYTVRIGANQTARIKIAHRGADLGLTAFKPSGEKFIETDSPAGFVHEPLPPVETRCLDLLPCPSSPEERDSR